MSKILIIDDERSIRNTLKDILEFEKHEVTLAEDGLVGLELLKTESFDLIFCDIKMPRMDGGIGKDSGRGSGSNSCNDFWSWNS